jgi:isopenicillin N synthase-like dioxygenase
LPIPTVDASATSEVTAAAVVAAGKDAGVLRVTGETRLLALSAEALAATRGVFDLPLEQKERLRSPTGFQNRGWNSYLDKAGNLNFERLSFAPFDTESAAIAAGASERHAMEYRHVNVWPDDGFRSLVDALRLAGGALCRRLLSPLCSVFDLPSGSFDVVGPPHTNVALTRYYPRPVARTEAADLSYVQHRDLAFATILTEEGERNSLQVLRGDEWVTVSADDASVLVLFGTLIPRLTSGRLRSCRHRVVPPQQRLRMTTIIGYSGGLQTSIRPPAGRRLAFDDPDWVSEVGDLFAIFAERSLP